MSPTCSNRDFAGRNALSATDLTNFSPRGAPGSASPTDDAPQDYVIDPLLATPNRQFGRSAAHRGKPRA